MKPSESCRLCLHKYKSKVLLLLSSAFPTNSSNRPITFLEAFNCCTQLQASPHDELPQCLCPTCASELQLHYQFLDKAKAADDRLRRQLQQKGLPTRSKVKWSEIVEVKDGTAELESYLESDLDEAFEQEVIFRSAKDPLEETDEEHEKEEKPNSDRNDESELGLECSAGSDDVLKAISSDDEDDKPLKELLYGVAQSKIVEDQFEAKATASQATRNERFSPFTQEEEEEAIETEGNVFILSNNLAENVPDLALSAEAQIFPQGRFKCKNCVKTYFTTVGLQAHLEVHLPKSTTTKKKRVRGPNKNKRKTKIATTQQEDLEEEEQVNAEFVVDQVINDEQKTETALAADEVVDQSIAKMERKPRKQKLPKPKKMFPCHVCGKHMISASKLRYHMVMHTGEKDYLCTMCPKAYSTIYALKHHMRTHTGERPYECKFCGDRFTRPTTLKSHMRRHTGERPYGCEICGKRFIQHSSMTTHMKLNHMAKTIKCPHCDKKYARQTDLNTHLLSHTGDKPFSCQLCPSRFIRQANLNKHMNQHHSPGAGGGSGRITNEAKTAKKKQKISKTTALQDSKSSGSTKFTQLCGNNHMQQQYNEDASIVLTAAKFEVNSNPIMPSLALDVSSRELLSLPLVQQAPNGDANIPQHLFAESTRLEPSIEDLNRWNWPNHA